MQYTTVTAKSTWKTFLRRCGWGKEFLVYQCLNSLFRPVPQLTTRATTLALLRNCVSDWKKWITEFIKTKIIVSDLKITKYHVDFRQLISRCLRQSKMTVITETIHSHFTPTKTAESLPKIQYFVSFILVFTMNADRQNSINRVDRPWYNS